MPARQTAQSVKARHPAVPRHRHQSIVTHCHQDPASLRERATRLEWSRRQRRLDLFRQCTRVYRSVFFQFDFLTRSVKTSRRMTPNAKKDSPRKTPSKQQKPTLLEKSIQEVKESTPYSNSTVIERVSEGK